jgi:hypothetical protein
MIVANKLVYDVGNRIGGALGVGNRPIVFLVNGTSRAQRVDGKTVVQETLLLYKYQFLA